MILYLHLHSYLISLISLPPVGVYLLEGGYDFHVGINIVCWFVFISPGIPLISSQYILTVAYVHGFGLLAFRKLWPRAKPWVYKLLVEIINVGIYPPRSPTFQSDIN